MFDKIYSVVFPTAGGVTGAVAKGTQSALANPERYLEVIVFAAIGAAVGYFVKLGFDALIKQCKNSKS